MITLYKKNELTFSLIWIGIYIVSFSVADGLSESLGTLKLITAPLSLVLTAVLWGWIAKNGLGAKCGLCPFRGSLRAYLYFLPLVLLTSVNLWGGVQLNYSVGESLLYLLSMLCVGFLEEIIFRGFLFQAIRKDGLRAAILISSLTFGLGHIINLLRGADFFSTLLQICYACAIGFLFTVIFYKSGSLIPCILVHSITNGLSTFSLEHSESFALVIAAFLTVVSVAYALYLLKKASPSPEEAA